MTTTAPMFSDVSLSDPDELMRVTNNGKVSFEWKGVRRVYLLEPGKPVWVPLHVCIRYLGDPRSKFKSTETFVTPTGIDFLSREVERLFPKK